jgi:hypothetical protein
MEALGGVLSAFGLAASAGLNAYIPLLILALAARFTNWIELSQPWDALTSWWVIGALAILTTIEFFADKFPAVNHVNDAVQTFVRPAAGAVLFAASTGTVTRIEPVVAIIAGVLVSGAVHTVKAAAVRPMVTATTGGAANTPVSVVEDMIAMITSILAIIIPVILAAMIIIVTAYIVWWLWRRANEESAASGAS